MNETALPTLDWAMDNALKDYLRLVLVAAHGNRCRAAAIAGCHRNTISRLCEGAGIPKGYGRKKSVKAAARERADALDRYLGRQP